MTGEQWRVGEVAQRTGLSVRTLHHYDEIGLLVPSRRASGEQRLYSQSDLARLERILALKSLGLSLEEIGVALNRPDSAPRELLARKLAELRGRITEEQRLVQRLEVLVENLGGREQATLEELVETMETLKMFEKYYTAEQLEQLKQRGAELGPEKIRAVQEEWPRLMAAMRAEMERGSDVSAPEVQVLAQRWSELIRMFTGGDAGIQRSLSNLHRGEPQMQAQTGLDPQLMAYVGRALSSRRTS
jgi:MerR family transcriptional regulator, thiopeptide resistance regulator